MTPAAEVRSSIAKAVEAAIALEETAAGFTVRVYPYWSDSVVVPAVVVDGPEYHRADRARIVSWSLRVILPDRPQPAAGELTDALFDALVDLEVPPWRLTVADVAPANLTVADVPHPGWLVTLADDQRALCRPPEPARSSIRSRT